MKPLDGCTYTGYSFHMDLYCSECHNLDTQSADGYSSCCNEFVTSTPELFA